VLLLALLWLAAPEPPGEAAVRAHAPEAAFAARSYAPGETAELLLWRGTASSVEIEQVGHAGGRRGRREPLAGRLVARIGPLRPGRRIVFRIGDWPSGLYAARIEGSGGVGLAAFVVRAASPGENRIAVVLPTNTWQAYNFRDVDGDGTGDTWYANPNVASVDLTRPYLGGGVPPRFRGYDRGFLRWLALRRIQVDVYADDDLERIPTGDRLARLYDLLVFPGHEEYVTTHAYDVVERFRDLGGNLMFLSANNFFYRVERRGSRLYRLGRWRDLGRPEAGLVGVQYVDWNRNRYPNLPYRVSGARRAEWLFAGTGLRDGDRFGRFGIEIDARTARSPAGTRVLATITDAFGPGKSAEMTYYETAAGAKVFAAGVINFGGSALWPVSSRLLDNLWRRLGAP
jgi:N,N-dimethylformamidase